MNGDVEKKMKPVVQFYQKRIFRTFARAFRDRVAAGTGRAAVPAAEEAPRN